MSDLLPHEPTVEVSWPRSDTALVVLKGEQDLASIDDVTRILDESLASCAHLIVDLSATEFIDSSTIRALVQAKRSADEDGRKFNVVLGSTPIVELALEITGVVPRLNRVRSLHEALAARAIQELAPPPDAARQVRTPQPVRRQR